MAYDTYLSDRISRVLKEKNIVFEEKKMMGGLCFMVDEKMCVGIVKESLMVRLNPEIQQEALLKEGCREMDFTKRPMRGFVYVDPEGIDTEDDLVYWIDCALEFNPLAKKSPKKKKKL